MYGHCKGTITLTEVALLILFAKWVEKFLAWPWIEPTALVLDSQPGVYDYSATAAGNRKPHVLEDSFFLLFL